VSSSTDFIRCANTAHNCIACIDGLALQVNKLTACSEGYESETLGLLDGHNNSMISTITMDGSSTSYYREFEALMGIWCFI